MATLSFLASGSFQAADVSYISHSATICYTEQGALVATECGESMASGRV